MGAHIDGLHAWQDQHKSHIVQAEQWAHAAHLDGLDCKNPDECDHSACPSFDWFRQVGVYAED